MYTSDHGDNVGSMRLWGKSNLYEELQTIPLIISGKNIEPNECNTPVSLLDLSETIVDHFDANSPNNGPGKSLYKIANENLIKIELSLVSTMPLHALFLVLMIRK